MKPKRKILQIATPAVPIFAVYNIGENDVPKTKKELFFRDCPVVATVENEREEIEVVGLCVEIFGLDEPSGAKNFLGYATTEEQAVGEFVSKSKK
jgi:hypothetical protein